MEDILKLYFYQCRVCHFTYFSEYEDANCPEPECDTENTPLEFAVYEKIQGGNYKCEKTSN